MWIKSKIYQFCQYVNLAKSFYTTQLISKRWMIPRGRVLSNNMCWHIFLQCYRKEKKQSEGIRGKAAGKPVHPATLGSIQVREVKKWGFELQRMSFILISVLCLCHIPVRSCKAAYFCHKRVGFGILRFWNLPVYCLLIWTSHLTTQSSVLSWVNYKAKS